MFVSLLVQVAFAHPELLDPPPRYPSNGFSDNKACPCGVGLTSRYCDDPNDRSDDDRSTNVTVYEPGQTIVMSWNEAIGHSGRWRVAFDDLNADMDDFNKPENILLDIEDPAGSAGNTGVGSRWEVSITLPDTPCENCTLQLIQMMNGNTTDPVLDPIGLSTYYQCADIVLRSAVDTAHTGDTVIPWDTAPDTAVAHTGVGPWDTTVTDTAGTTGMVDTSVGATGVVDTAGTGVVDTAIAHTGSTGATDTSGPLHTGESGSVTWNTYDSTWYPIDSFHDTAATGTTAPTADTALTATTGDTAVTTTTVPTPTGDTSVTTPTTLTTPTTESGTYVTPTFPTPTITTTTPTEETGDSASDSGEKLDDSGCGCESGGASFGWVLMVLPLVLGRRRRV